MANLNTHSKPFFKSKEIWVLGTAILIGATQFFGLDFPMILDEATSIWMGIAPVVALIIRLFWTKDKLEI